MCFKILKGPSSFFSKKEIEQKHDLGKGKKGQEIG